MTNEPIVMRKILAIIAICGSAEFTFSQNFGIGEPNPQQKLDVSGNIRMTGNTFVANGANSNYGAMTVQGERGNWGGLNFKRANGTNLGTFMIQEDYSGVYNNSDNDWDWYFVNGSMAAGNIPPQSVKCAVWSGGCNYHGTAGGWNTYCNNSVDFNSASGYVSADGGGTFTVQKSGNYRINAWAISLGNNYNHIIFYHNGTYRQYEYEYVHGAWSDNFLDVTWPMNAGDTFFIQYYNSGNYAFHSWNSQGAHSRIQIVYEGTF